MPVVTGAGRGLRVCFGKSTLMRLVSRVEPRVEDAFLELLRGHTTVFDVGANVGWYSLLAARSGARVVAFEPSLANAACLRRNARANGLEVNVVVAAVGDHDGWASFDDSTSLGGKLAGGGNATVPVLSLDSWLVEREPPSLVKMDVEGAEGAVLRGMVATLNAARPALLIELHGTNFEVASLLDDAAYSHAPVDHPAPTRDAPWWVHVLAIPK